MGSTTDTSIAIPELDYETEYFFRIDSTEMGGVGSLYTGPVWSFTTHIPACDPPLAGDTDGNCFVEIVDFCNLAGEWLSCNWDIPDLCP